MPALCKPEWRADKVSFENKILPNSMRLLLIGKTDCGKSFLLLRLLLEDYLDYNNLVLYTPSLKQTEYQILVEGFKHGLDKQEIRAIFDKQDEIEDPISMIKSVSKQNWLNKAKINVQAFDNDADIPKPETFDKKKKNLVVFDDCAFDDQSNLHAYFIRGRHYNINCIYLSQNYFELPKNSIRDNSNAFVFFKATAKNVQNIYQDIGAMDFDEFSDFKAICKEAWKKKHSYLFVNTTEDNLTDKYIINAFE
jgi:GTPase SAR1 family protein